MAIRQKPGLFGISCLTSIDSAGDRAPNATAFTSQFSVVVIRLTVNPYAEESDGRKGWPLEGVLKVLTLAMRIAMAWTLLSLLVTVVWCLLLEVGRRFGSRFASKPLAREEGQLSAEIRALYAEFDRARSDALAHDHPDEPGESDVLVFIRWSRVGD
jgi:hypothetical protein